LRRHDDALSLVAPPEENDQSVATCYWQMQNANKAYIHVYTLSADYGQSLISSFKADVTLNYLRFSFLDKESKPTINVCMQRDFYCGVNLNFDFI